MSYQIIGGASQRFYHAVPTDLDLITTTPTREGIFKYLSQIGFDKFPEFILDILVKVEGHMPGDVTDGQGDEKQDIITFTPTGERCLTQCKHTISYADHYNGDDLDKMVSATMRKSCRNAIFVTNSDLTPQGKKYITDDEYNRGISNPAERRSIDYWNGYKIWERIKNNQDIINKWFSGLGQVHGLRTFRFNITIQQMPFQTPDASEGNVFERIVKILNERGRISEKHGDKHHITSLSKDYVLGISEWFQFASALDINFALPTAEISFVNRRMFAVSVEVVASHKFEDAKALAQELGSLAKAAEVSAAIKEAEIIVLAVWFNTIKGLLTAYASELPGKIIVDPSNPIAPDGNGGFKKITGEQESAGQINAGLLPKGANLAKALGTLGAGSLESAAFQKPEPAVLFYATDDNSINTQIEELIKDNGFDPVRVGGIDQSIRIEVFGELHEFGALGKTITLSELKHAV